MRKLFAVLLMVLSFSLVQAAEARRVAEDPVLEAKVQSVSALLRCLVCQNQNLADSHADLAIDLKNQVRDMLGKGKSEKEVIDYMVERYGDFVLYLPPLKRSTWLLWIGPFVLLFGGLAALFIMLKRRRGREQKPLSEDERTVAARLLQS